MVDKIIFTHPSLLYPSQLYPQDLVQRKSYSHQFKLKNPEISDAQLENWLFEMASKGVDVARIQMQFPTGSLFGDMNKPQNEQQSTLLARFETVKTNINALRDEVFNQNIYHFTENWRTIAKLKVLFTMMDAPFDFKTVLLNIDNWKNHVALLEQLTETKLYSNPVVKQDMLGFLKKIVNSKFLGLCVEMNEHGLLNASTLDKIIRHRITSNMLDTQIWKKQDTIAPEAIQVMLEHPQSDAFFKVMDDIWAQNPDIDISKWILHLSQIKKFGNLEQILHPREGAEENYGNLFQDISFLDVAEPQEMIDLIMEIKDAPIRHFKNDKYDLIEAIIRHKPDNLFEIKQLINMCGLHNVHELIVEDKLLERFLGKIILENIDKFHDLNALQSVLYVLMHTSQATQKNYENDVEKLANIANDMNFIRLHAYLNQQHKSFKEALTNHPQLMDFVFEHASPIDVVFVLGKLYPLQVFDKACEKIIHCPDVTVLANVLEDRTLGINKNVLLTNFEGLFSNPDLNGFANCLRLLHSRNRRDFTKGVDRLVELHHLSDFSRRLQAHPELIPYFAEMMTDRQIDIHKLQHLIDDVWTDEFLSRCGDINLHLFCNANFLYKVFENASHSNSPREFFNIINELQNEVPEGILHKLASHPHLEKISEFLQMKKFHRPYDQYYRDERDLDSLLDDDILNALPTLRWMLMKGDASIQQCVEMIKNVPEIIGLGERYDSSLFSIYQFLKSKSLDADSVLRHLCELPHGIEFCTLMMNTPHLNTQLQDILQSDDLFERSELIYRAQSCSTNFSNLLLFMPNPKEFYDFLMTIPHEQQHEVFTRIDQLAFVNPYYLGKETLALILSAPQPLLLLDVMEHYFSKMECSINEYTLNAFSKFMSRFNVDELPQVSEIIKLFMNKKEIFNDIAVLFEIGMEFDAQLLRRIGEHEQASKLVRIMAAMYEFGLLSGDQKQKNIDCLFQQLDLNDMFYKLAREFHTNYMTQDMFERLFYENDLSEPKYDNYIGVDKKRNQVHIYLPLTRGQQIGTDNTCKSAEALRATFGYTQAEDSLALSLQKYILDLKKDIARLRSESKLCQQKKERLQQLEKYQISINDVNKLPDIQALSLAYPEYPDGMKAIMRRPEANLYSMQLSPKFQDGYLRMVNPTFSLRMIDKSAVEPLLRDVLSQMDFPPEDRREMFIQMVLDRIDSAKVRLTDVEELLSRETENQFGYPAKYELERFTPALRETLNQMNLPSCDLRESFIQGVLKRVAAEPEMTYERLQDILASHAELIFGEKGNYRGVPIQSIYDVIGDENLDLNTDVRCFIEGLLGLASPELFAMGSREPFQQKFTGDKEGDRLSITVQFYLAEINIYCYQQEIGHQNFGLMLQNDDLRRAFLECLRGCTIETIEHHIFDFVSQHHADFGLSRPLDMNDYERVQRDFYSHFLSVMETPHYDEFSILNVDKNGGFFSHDSHISIDYLDYLKEAIPNHALNQDAQMQAILASSKQLPVNTFHPVEKIEDLSLEGMKAWVEEGYPLGFLLAKLNEPKQLEVLMDFGKFALDILEGSPQERQNIKGNIAPQALAYLQDLSIAFDKSYVFPLNPAQIECRNALEILAQHFPEESKWLRALLIRDVTEIGSGLECFPNMPSKFIDAVFAQPTLLARINHILAERDAPPLKTPEDLAVYRNEVNMTTGFKQRLPTKEESSAEFKPKGPS